jgi:uncharacterized protein (TIRG00374 family)
MKLVVNLLLSLVVLAACVWLVWPNAHDRVQLEATLRAIELKAFWPYLAGCVGLLGVTHFFRAQRWNDLLQPLGAAQPLGRLLAVSTVGFMAILALPARLGEFARPLLLRRHSGTRFSVLLGTVVVERVIDLMMVAVLVAVCFFALHGPASPPWMLPTAWASVAILVIGSVVLWFGSRAPESTARILSRPLPARLRGRGSDFVLNVFRGFQVLRHGGHTASFITKTVIYWVANGLSMWLLARGMGLHLSVIGAFATMGLVAVGIMLPNAPGLVGQFHWFTKLGLSLYLGQEVVEAQGLAYALVLHGIQVTWYVGLGILVMLATRVHLADLVKPRGELKEPLT